MKDILESTSKFLETNFNPSPIPPRFKVEPITMESGRKVIRTSDDFWMDFMVRKMSPTLFEEFKATFEIPADDLEWFDHLRNNL